MPPGNHKLGVFIGDSFLEALPTSRSLPAAVEQRFAAVGRTDTEAINLGVSGTGPPSYYYRLRDVSPGHRVLVDVPPDGTRARLAHG